MHLDVNEEEMDRLAKHPMNASSPSGYLSERDIIRWKEEREVLVAHAVDVIEDIGADVIIAALIEMGITREPRLWDDEP